MRTGRLVDARPDRRSPSFRRSPFARDVVFDFGETTASRMARPHMWPSAHPTASALARYPISELNTHPMQSLSTLRRWVAPVDATRATRRTLLLTWTGLSPAGYRQLWLAHWMPGTSLDKPGHDVWVGVVAAVKRSGPLGRWPSPVRSGDLLIKRRELHFRDQHQALVGDADLRDHRQRDEVEAHVGDVAAGLRPTPP